MRSTARLALGVACAAGLVGACQSERPRPAPPVLNIVLDRTLVHSPDTLKGTLRAQDPDGIDSVWLAVDSSPRAGEDGLLQTAFESRFRSLVRAGHGPGDRIAVILEARDVTGFRSRLDTSATVVP